MTLQDFDIQSSDESDNGIASLSHDNRLNKLLKTVVREVRLYAEDQIRHIRQGAEIGKALSVENDLNKLLEMIVHEARAMSNADGGTLYILDKEHDDLRVEILQNDTIPDGPITLPNVPLYKEDGMENHSNVSSHVALTGKIVNIPDVYEAGGFDFAGTRKYDASTGYRSRSMLVIPLRNHESEIIGVLQLLNAQDTETRQVIAFSPEYVDLIASLASQAAVAITNARLIRNLKTQIRRIKQGAEIGKALLVGKDDINRVLEMIVDEARAMSHADAGTVYILDEDRKSLRVEIFHNDSMKTRMCGSANSNMILPNAPFTLPQVPLYNRDGEPNYAQVSSFVALTGGTLNIPDVYEIEGFDFTGPKNYDMTTGYRTKSMLVIPLKNHEDDVIGVLQLLNAQTDRGKVVAFSKDHEELIESLASQASVAMTNARLVRDLKDLFYRFIEGIAGAIDEKSAYTGGHIKRVVELTMMIAQKINETDEGPFKDVFFNENEMEELRLSAWMHDIGKITTPEHIMDKKTKLESIYDRIDLIKVRFDLIAGCLNNQYLQEKIAVLENGARDKAVKTESLDKELADKLRQLQEDFEFLKSCNNTGDFMPDNKVERVRQIGAQTYISADGKKYPYLTPEEIENLCIRKGTLNDAERQIIQRHSDMTYKILCTLPFSKTLKSLANVPDYAAAHHERPDGTGYPLGLSGKNLPLQPRIMAVADIFEALTARDRPYKKPMTLSQAIKILGFMKKDGQIDPDVYDLFVQSRIYRAYAEREIHPDQIDE